MLLLASLLIFLTLILLLPLLLLSTLLLAMLLLPLVFFGPSCRSGLCYLLASLLWLASLVLLPSLLLVFPPVLDSCCWRSLIFRARIYRPQFRVSSKQKNIYFGSNRNKPKQDLFRVCFGLFRETKNKLFRFVSVFRTYIETTETNRNNPKFSEKYENTKKICFETNRKKLKTPPKKPKNGKTLHFL